MKFWIDILTPKQARFFKYFSERYDCYITTRDYIESLVAIKELNLKCEIIGKHGKDTLEKLIFSIKRLNGLLEWYLKNKPKALISHGSVEATRISFQAGIPIFDFYDSPESTFASRLVAPLTTLMIVPKNCGHMFKKFGAQEVIEYDGLTPVTWLKRYNFNFNKIKKLKIDFNKITIVIREPAYLAAHIESDKNFFTLLIKEIKRFFNETNIIILERYKGYFIDVPTLLQKADIVIATGSIIGEALVSGVPLILDYLPIVQKMYEKYVKENLIIHAKKVEDIIENVKKYLKNPSKRREPLYKKMEDPLEIFDKILKERFSHLL